MMTVDADRPGPIRRLVGHGVDDQFIIESFLVNEGNLLNDHETPHSLPLATSICAR